MYCEKCKKSFAEIADGVCPICGALLVEQPQNGELLCAIEQLKQGNQDGFLVVYEHTYTYVYSRAKTLCDDPEDIADVVQEVYAALVQNIASLRSNESIFAWLRTVTFHAGSRILKKKKHETVLSEENEEWLESLPDESADAESDFVNQEDIEIIRGCINRLPDELRTVVLAYYYDNLKVEEIAHLLDVPAGTVKSRLFVARKKIKQYIEEEEHRLGYKLHSFNAVSLLMAIRSLLQENMVSGEAQKAAMYTRICSELSLSAGSGAATTSVTITGTSPSASIAKTAVGAVFKKAAFLNVCKTVIAVVCGVAVIATAAFAGEHLVRKHGNPASNDVIVNYTTGTTTQTLEGSTTSSAPLNTTYTSTVASDTTTSVSSTETTTSTTAQISTTTSQTTTATTSVATKDYDPDPTHEPPQPGDVYETKDYIYRYQWYSADVVAEFNPAYVDTAMGWSVIAKSEQTEYEALFDTIYGEPVTIMFYTYCEYYAMTVAPAVPKYVTHMDFTYIGTSITTAPALPETVIQLGYTFCRTPITEAPILPSRVESLFYTFCGCKNLKTAPVIPDSVIDMEGAFDGCKNLKTAPVIPENVRDLDVTFHGCSSLVTAPVIPQNVSNLYETFYGCSSLTGTIIINSKEVFCSDGGISAQGCFFGTEKPITLTGAAPKEILLALAESSLNNNVTVDS